MNSYLRSGEGNVIPMAARHILEELVRRKWTIRFDNTEAPIAGSVPAYGGEPYQWIMRVLAPTDMGGRMELLVTDSPDLYEQVADQTLRYLRMLFVERDE